MTRLATETMPDGLRLRDTATHRFVVNYAAQPQTWQDHVLPACDALILPRQR